MIYQKQATTFQRTQVQRALNAQVIQRFDFINADLVWLQTGTECSQKKIKFLEKCEPDRKLKIFEALEGKAGENRSAVDSTACEIIPTHGSISAQAPDRAGTDGLLKISPLWAQQAIGADLAAELVENSRSRMQIERVGVGLLDIMSSASLKAPISDGAVKLDLLPPDRKMIHGEHVADLISSPPHGVSPNVEWKALINLAARQDNDAHEAWNSNLIAGIDELRGARVRLANASIGFFGDAPRRAINSYVDSGNIFVQSSGNDFPVASWGQDKPRVGHITVGSVGPNSMQSPFSQEPVKIYAPSDGVLLSDKDNRFGGTSGAAPLVSGTIANVLSFNPSLPNAEVERILTETSLPTLANGTIGSGILNTFRATAVAQCQQRAKNQKARLACFDQSQKAAELEKHAAKLLAEASCPSQKEGLKSLRASFLLNPSAEKATKLAKFYQSSKYPNDADWYLTLAASLGTGEQRRNEFIRMLDEPSLHGHRYFAGGNLGVTSRGFYAFTLAARLPKEHEFSQIALDHIARLVSSNVKEKVDEGIKKALVLGPRAFETIRPYLVEAPLDSSNSLQTVIRKYTMYDGITHPWREEATKMFNGTPLEKYLYKSNTSRYTNPFAAPFFKTWCSAQRTSLCRRILIEANPFFWLVYVNAVIAWQVK